MNSIKGAKEKVLDDYGEARMTAARIEVLLPSVVRTSSSVGRVTTCKGPKQKTVQPLYRARVVGRLSTDGEKMFGRRERPWVSRLVSDNCRSLRYIS